MDRRQAAQDGPVTDLDVPAERGVVDQDDVVADLAVMGHVAADHE